MGYGLRLEKKDILKLYLFNRHQRRRAASREAGREKETLLTAIVRVRAAQELTLRNVPC